MRWVETTWDSEGLEERGKGTSEQMRRGDPGREIDPIRNPIRSDPIPVVTSEGKGGLIQ